MKRRSILYRIMIAAIAVSLTGASEVHASGMPTPTPSSEPKDTVLTNATKGLIESFGELSKTATKLSETALKLIEAQKALEGEERGEGERRERGERRTTQAPVKNQTVTRTRKTSTGSQQRPAQRQYETIEEPPVLTPDYGEEEEYEITNSSAGVLLPDGTLEEEEYTGPRVFISDESSTNATDSDESSYGTPEGDDDSLKSLWDLKPEERKGGRYVWVPDGEELTLGTSADKVPNLQEKTYWRGDSIYMALPTKRYGRYDRKLYNWLIYPRGLWHISLSANYGELSTEDSEILSLMKDIDVNGKIYSIKPSVSYFFKHNLCAGIRLAFTKGDLGVDSFKLDIDEDMNFNLHDIKYTSESYSAAIFLQQYFGLSRRGRFAVYNEVEIAAGTGNKHFIRPFDGNMRDTRTKTQSFNINYSPGVSIMMMKNAAFNLSFGIFGFHLQKEKQWENGEESGDRLTSGINFRFNIFNINFGVSIII